MNSILKRYLGMFEDLKITQKLSVLLRVALGGFAIIGLIYVIVVWTVAHDRTQLQRVSQFNDLVSQVQTGGFEARSDEKDFLLTHNSLYAQKHATAMATVFDRLSQLVNLGVADEKQTATIADARQYMTTYQDAFNVAVQKAATLGSEEGGGIQGSFRDQVQALETAVTGSGDAELLAAMLTMRRDEKDFLSSRNDQYVKAMGDDTAHWQRLMLKARLSESERANIATLMNGYQKGFYGLVAAVKDEDAAVRTMQGAFENVQPRLDQLAQLKQVVSAQIIASATFRTWLMTAILGSVLTLVALLLSVGIRLLSRGVQTSLGRLLDTIASLAQGDSSARVRLESRDELGELGKVFDGMMDERVALQQKIERENEQLNNSVVSLLRAVAQLARKDLTVKVPVAEDVTGALADALNVLTTETSKVLTEVTNISADVTSASLKVKQQSDTVVEVAETGRREVEKTAEELAGAATAMNQIAVLAQACNVAADNAINTAQKALQTVNATVGGINNTRDTIRETEKRIKRLGERSQEISTAVNLINTIAERTHILALNASMHAASAGEAGRGFAVVAEEVQRLAENARQATAQITTLVNNIQVETADTASTMNEAISQVVQGSKLAEEAGEQMKRTQQTTEDLVKSVQEIAANSQVQAKVSNQLLERAGEIRKATQHTSDQLKAQTEQTNNLVAYAKSLLGAVRVFKLQQT